MPQTGLCSHCQPPCPLIESDQGHLYCENCGTVVESGLDFANGVTFANMRMEGQVVDTNERSNKTSTERRLRRAQAKIDELKALLHIELDDDKAIEAAMRVIRYADTLGFFDKGKNVELYAAAALYTTLRFVEAPYLLIDFSDKMNVSLFKLARCFLKLLRFLGFQNQLPLIDPSLYIHRYCKMLDLGDRARAVALTAVKLVQGMKRDWMCQGRRPSSLCGAAILIATIIQDVSCSTTDICKTVVVCDETIRRRLAEFKQTSVAKLTKEEFERMEPGVEDFGQEMDPPAFSKARAKSKQEALRREMIAQIQTLPKKEKLDKQEWAKYKEALNISDDYIVKQMEGMEEKFKLAKDQLGDQDFAESDESSATQEEIFEEDEGSEQVRKEEGAFDDEEIDKFILSEEDRQAKMNLWIKHNQTWLEKEKSKIKNLQHVSTRKAKPKKTVQPSKNIFESIKATKLGQSVNDDELKKLLLSQPQQPVKPKIDLAGIFNPFAFAWNQN